MDLLLLVRVGMVKVIPPAFHAFLNVDVLSALRTEDHQNYFNYCYVFYLSWEHDNGHSLSIIYIRTQLA